LSLHESENWPLSQTKPRGFDSRGIYNAGNRSFLPLLQDIARIGAIALLGPPRRPLEKDEPFWVGSYPVPVEGDSGYKDGVVELRLPPAWGLGDQYQESITWYGSPASVPFLETDSYETALGKKDEEILKLNPYVALGADPDELDELCIGLKLADVFGQRFLLRHIGAQLMRWGAWSSEIDVEHDPNPEH